MPLNSSFLIGVPALFDLNPGFFKPLIMCSCSIICVLLNVTVSVVNMSFVSSPRMYVSAPSALLLSSVYLRSYGSSYGCGTRNRLPPLAIFCNVATNNF